MGRRKLKAGKKKKRVLVRLIEREHEGQVVQAYRLLDELIDQHHARLRNAKVALAWRYGWKVNPDDRLTLGQAKKAGDLDREMHHFDFVILLNHEAWNEAQFSEKQMRALLDHELVHCEVAKDDKGEVKEDDFGRTCYRIRKHDVEEFTEIVARHGLWKSDLEKFARVMTERAKAPLLAQLARKGKPAAAPDEDPPRWRATSLDDLGILGETADHLASANIMTLGAIIDFTKSLKLTDINGVGEAAAKEIQDAVRRYWTEHPQQQAAVA
jgi:hypothetical protein